jgi:hypothetical protein
LAAKIALRDHIRNLLQSKDADSLEIARFLQAATPRDWLILDESMRAQWYGGYGEVPRPGFLARAWRALRSKGESRPAIVSVGIASMDRDGRVRESAVRQLALESDPLAGPFLVLRTADWVAEVAKAAASVLRDRLPNEPTLLIASAPIVFALADRRRQSDLDQIVLEGAAVNPDVRTALSKADVRTRRRLIDYEPVRVASTIDDLVAIAISDLDMIVASAAGVAAVSRITDAGAPREGLDRLLAAPALVRRAVLDALPTSERTRSLAQRHLFDRNPLVRGAAQQAHARSGGEPSMVYRAALAKSEHVPIAVLELAHIGSADDHEAALAALQSPDAAARRAAVQAARWIAGDRLSDHLVPLLWDPSPGVTRAVEKGLRGMAKSLDSGMLDALASAPGIHNRRAGYRLLRRRTTHERVEADLIGLADEDDANRRNARGDLTSWLHRGAASAPRADLTARRRLSQRLDAVEDQLLPRDVERIRFHAALRAADLGG